MIRSGTTLLYILTLLLLVISFHGTFRRSATNYMNLELGTGSVKIKIKLKKSISFHYQNKCIDFEP